MATATTQTKKRTRRGFVGKVVSNIMAKTIVVETFRLEKHGRYGKFLRKSSLFKVHDEKGLAKVGDKVKIVETRPVSKTKFFKLDSVVEKGQRG